MMWYNFIKGYGFRNISKGGQISGFQFKIHLPYYRGLWVSQAFQNLAVRVDGVDYPLDKISVKIGDRTWRWAEINGAYDVFWYYAEPATIMVDKPGGLTMGVHKVECDIHYSRSYSTMPSEAHKTELFVEPEPGAADEAYGFGSNDPERYEWRNASIDMVLVI